MFKRQVDFLRGQFAPANLLDESYNPPFISGQPSRNHFTVCLVCGLPTNTTPRSVSQPVSVVLSAAHVAPSTLFGAEILRAGGAMCTAVPLTSAQRELLRSEADERARRDQHRRWRPDQSESE